MKFHDDRCKGKAVMRREPKCGRTDGRTGGQTDMVIPVYPPPPNFVAGDIMNGSIRRIQGHMTNAFLKIRSKTLKM